MALVRTNRINSQSSTGVGTGSYTTGSFTPSNSSLVVVIVFGGSGTATTATNLTIADSLGTLTWTSQFTLDDGWGVDSGAFRVWTAPVTTGASMTVTIDAGSDSYDQFTVFIVDYTGYNTGSPIGTTASNNNSGTDGALTITLGASPATDSEVIGVIGRDDNTAGTVTSDPGAGWSEQFDLDTTQHSGAELETRTGSTSTSVAWADIQSGTAGPVLNSMAFAIEIKAASAAAAVENLPPTVTYDPWTWLEDVDFFPDSEVGWTGTVDFDIPPPIHVIGGDVVVSTSDVSVAGYMPAGVHPFATVTADRGLTGTLYSGPVPFGTSTADRNLAGLLEVGPPVFAAATADRNLTGTLYSGPVMFTSGGFDYPTTGILYSAPTVYSTVSHTTSVTGTLYTAPTVYSTVTADRNLAGLLPAGVTLYSTVSHAATVTGLLELGTFAYTGPSFDYNTTAILYADAVHQATITASRSVAGLVHAAPFNFAPVTVSMAVTGLVPLGPYAVATITRSASIPALLVVGVYARADVGPIVALPGITDTVRRRDTGTILQVGTGTLRARQTGTMTGGASTGTMRVRVVDSDSIQIL